MENQNEKDLPNEEGLINKTGEAFLIYIEDNLVIVNTVTMDSKIKEKIRAFVTNEIEPNQSGNHYGMNQYSIKTPSF